MERPYDYDVAIVTDLRYPGGNSSSIVEEVKAQAVAGYSTVLVHMPAGHMKRQRSFNHKVIHTISTGMATLVPATRRLKVRALIVRQPRIFAEQVTVNTRIDADARVLVINHPPFDGRNPIERPYYRTDEVRERSEEMFGELLWAPIGPAVRRSLEESAVATGANLELTQDDWHNVINVDEWRASRTRFVADRPVIGRHSRAHRVKWPEDPEHILAAYPEDDAVGVQILGGAEPAIAALGRVPANWTIHPFGSMSPVDFLRQIDFFVYYHHPGWVEAFGRNSIEAMASGVPLILPESFEQLFGDAALYGQPADVRGTVERLYGDREAYDDRVESGNAFVSQQFGAGVHIRRLQDLIGPADGRRAQPSPPPRRQRVLLVSQQGRGGGSAARLLRLARALPRHLEPVFVASGDGARMIAAAGHIVDHVQFSRPHAGSRAWLSRRMREIIERERPGLIVVDGRSLVRGVEDAVRRSEVPAVWLTPRRRLPNRDRCEAFRAVLSVEDLSRVARRYKDAATNVLVVPSLAASSSSYSGPVAVRPSDEAPRALVALGSDGPAGQAETARTVVSALRDAGFDPVVAEPLSGEPLDRGLDDDVETTVLGAAVPAGSYALAVVMAPGHTLVHDLLRARIAVALLEEPDDGGDEPHDLLDARRLVASISTRDPVALTAAFRRLADPGVRERLVGRGRPALQDDGAAVVAGIVEDLLRRPEMSVRELEAVEGVTRLEPPVPESEPTAAA